MPRRTRYRRSGPRGTPYGRTGRRDWLWAAAIVVVVAAGLVSAFFVLSGSGSTGPDIAGVPCERGEKLNYHVHSRLAVFVEGQQVQVPANIGITSNCLYWLHTHTSDGIIHVEAPSQRDFTLGQFFAIWGQTLGPSQLMDRTVDPGHQIQATVNGQVFGANPADIQLQDGTSIVVQYGPPFVQASTAKLP